MSQSRLACKGDTMLVVLIDADLRAEIALEPNMPTVRKVELESGGRTKQNQRKQHTYSSHDMLASVSTQIHG